MSLDYSKLILGNDYVNYFDFIESIFELEDYQNQKIKKTLIIGGDFDINKILFIINYGSLFSKILIAGNIGL